MDHTYWHRQTLGTPLFEAIEWAKPENRQAAGKLLIIGGHAHAMSKIAEAYQAALKAGVGQVRMLLPEALKKIVGNTMPDIDFAPSGPSGSFAAASLDSFLQLASWADGVLLPGDLGRNSETAIVLEKFVRHYSGLLVLARDASDYFRDRPLEVLNRANTVLVLSFADLQKLASTSGYSQPFTYEMDLLRLVDQLHTFSTAFACSLITLHHNQLLVASGGQVSSTKLAAEPSAWRAKAAARAAVYGLQHPSKLFEALTTSAAHEIN